MFFSVELRIRSRTLCMLSNHVSIFLEPHLVPFEWSQLLCKMLIHKYWLQFPKSIQPSPVWQFSSGWTFLSFWFSHLFLHLVSGSCLMITMAISASSTSISLQPIFFTFSPGSLYSASENVYLFSWLLSYGSKLYYLLDYGHLAWCELSWCLSSLAATVHSEVVLC